LLMNLPRRADIRVGKLGKLTFDAGVYVYVGSAISGIEQRVRRHKSVTKRMKWHIDYFLRRAEILAIVAIPCDKKGMECEVARALAACEGARISHKGFGSSDCACSSHLMYFGDSDPGWVGETLSMRLSMLECVYPRIDWRGHKQ
ncbi:MAG: GIY-YIG nuclease family protein, partial [Thermoplasmata archaeon]